MENTALKSNNSISKADIESQGVLNPSISIDIDFNIKKATESIQHIIEPLILDYQIKYNNCKKILDDITILSLTSEFKSELNNSKSLKKLVKILKDNNMYEVVSTDSDVTLPARHVEIIDDSADGIISTSEVLSASKDEDGITNTHIGDDGSRTDTPSLSLILKDTDPVYNETAPTTPPSRKFKKSWASPSSSDGSEILNHFELDHQARQQVEYNELCENVSKIEETYESINKSNFEELLCQSRNALQIRDNNFKLTIELYNKSGQDILVLSESQRVDLESEYRKLRGKLVKFKETPQNKLRHLSYKKLWNFVENMIIYHRQNIKLNPCKKDLSSQRCNGTYCSFHHQNENKIYKLLIPDHRNVLTFDNQFEEIKSSDNFGLFEDFIIKIHNYLYYNEICRFKNNCRCTDCNKIHNIHEQLYIHYLWNSKWKPYIVHTSEFKSIFIQDHESIITEYILDKSWNRIELYDAWKHDYGL
tara:strand:+ start:6168 stop:7598 length:1431 start_codon:yes stop_codon:yes gene_type:complete